MTKSVAFIILSATIAISGVNCQADTWINVARDVSSDFVNFLANFPIPFLDNFQVPPVVPVGPRPVLPPTAPPTPRVTIINGQPFLVFDPATTRPNPPPVPSPSVSPRDTLGPLLSLYQLLNGLNSGHQNPGNIITLPRPSPPAHHNGPCHSGCGCGCKGPECKPERVRIVVVDDCNDKKKKKSSESCSSESKSDEVDIVVPRTGPRTMTYRV